MRDLAGDTTLGTQTVIQLYAGEAPVVSSRIKAATGVAFAKYEVYAMSAAGEAIKFDQAGSAPANKAVGIFAQPVAAAGWGPVFTAGAFNHAALVWPAATDTFAERATAFAGTDIHIERLL